MSKRRGQGEDGFWYDRKTRYYHFSIENGYLPNGTRDRVRGKSRNKARLLEKYNAAKLDKLTNGVITKRTRPVPKAPALTVESWLKTWLYDIQKPRLRPSSWRRQRCGLELHAVPAIGHIRLDELTVDDVRTMLLAIRAAGRVPTSKAVHRALNAALNAAVAEEKITRNVAALVGLSRADAKRDDSLDFTEARAILKHVRTSPDVTLRDRILTELRLFLGARPQELLGLEPDRVLELDNLDNDNADPRVEISWQLQSIPSKHGCPPNKPCGKGNAGWCPKRQFDIPDDYEHRPIQDRWCLVRPKTARSTRALSIPVGTATAIAQYLQTRPATDLSLLFVSDTGTVVLDKDDLSAWRAICKAAGIERQVDRYIGRHTAASLMAALGIDPETQRDIMGHTTITTTNGYKHRSRAQLRLAVNTLADELDDTQDEPLSA